MIKKIVAAAMLMLVGIGSLAAQSAGGGLLPYQNPQLSHEQRARDLLSRLTLEEKAQLMLDVSEAIPRLGIKKFNWWSEALHGVANQDDVTVFPEPIGMAASFNDALVYDVFTATSDEMRAKYNDDMNRGIEDRRFHSLSVWTPNVNIFRDPRWGRGQETYGEDPYLTSRMGCAVVNGLQGKPENGYLKLYACAKHYAIHSGPEWARHTDNLTNISDRDLWETYMPAFKALVQKADVREVMCAYQRWNDEPCCGNTRLLQQILRDEWGFKHMVVSDCGAVSDFWTSHKSSPDAVTSAAVGVLAGTDVECGYDYAYKSIPEAVKKGLIKESDVDEKVLRLLIGRFELGEMDQPSLVPWRQIPMSVVCSPEHHNLSLDMARQTMTLLQNKKNILPLSKSVKKIAVLGPNADNQTMLWGNYNGQPKSTITILKGIQEKLPNAQINYIRGCDLVHDQLLTSFYDQCSFDGKPGMKGTFWNNQKREGQPVTTLQVTKPLSVSTYGNYPFAPGVNLTKFSAKYETVFKPKESGRVLLSMEGCSYFELFVNGKSMKREYTWRTTPTRTEIDVEAGKEYNIEILFAQVETYNANLKFDLGRESAIDYNDIIKQLKGTDLVVFVGGIAPSLEGEEMPVSLPGFKGGDRTDIELPAVQRNFLKALKQAGKKVVLVNCSGSAIALRPETETCDAILQAWYAGEAGGQAVADVLFGDYNPSGKLPVTFYASTEDLPDYQDYSMKNRTYRYWTPAPKGEGWGGAFPFGFGLSYTTFNIGNATVSATTAKAGTPITITVPVKNTGKRLGTEVVQVYIKKDADVNGPIRSLKAYKRITLKPGETQKAELTLDAEAFEFFDESTNTIRIVPGSYIIYYGNSSADVDLKSLKITLTEGLNEVHNRYFTPAGTGSIAPDNDGFLRRWLLLEPMNKPNRTNIVFTDSYLRDAFKADSLPGNLAQMPAIESTINFRGQDLKWHPIDSKLYNVKLFRFADGLKAQVYGVLFNAATIIECDDDIEDVRLAVGSNSASMWWIDGEEVAILSGDRRMVRDDVISQRITLKKGRHILRGAIINGPGMSDFCVRFLNEDGSPVTSIRTTLK